MKEADKDDAIPLPRLIHALHSTAHVSVTEAMTTVHALAQSKRCTRAHLRRISAPELEEIGAPCKGATRDRIVQVLQSVALTNDSTSLSEAERMEKQQRLRTEAQVRREWGNVATPSRVGVDHESEDTFDFHPVLDESTLRGRHVVVNRAPVMTAWAVVVLQQLGFGINEALSLAQCYVSLAAEARARTLQRPEAMHSGRTPLTVSENQPHIEFLHTKIPVICLRNGQYRGLHAGDIVPPSRAFEYLRRSMFQTLPQVMGALTLLANSYVDRDGSTTALQTAAYGLYADFRPETHGEWGKRATLSLDTILALRRPPALTEEKQPHRKAEDDQGSATPPAREKQEESVTQTVDGTISQLG